MQQQQQLPQDDSAATFYAKLVNVTTTAESYGVGQSQGASEAAQQQVWQQQQQQQQQATIPFKPVKFAQPVVLDPNTGVITLPSKESGSQHNQLDKQQTTVRIKPPPARNARGTGTGSSSQAAQHLDLASQASRYHTASTRSTRSTAAAAAHPTAPSAYGSSSKRPIDRGNVGYQLLQKAGWREGSGLGREGQGMAAPLQVQPQKGSKGLGFVPQDPLQLQRQQIADAAAAAAAAAGGAVAAPAGPAAGPVLGGKRVAALVAAELASEDLETKVKRHRQVMEQEAKEKRDKAIQLYMQRAFNEPSLADVGDHANVLGRSSWLTRTNPLLDDDDD
jgi:hypothetical protein